MKLAHLCDPDVEDGPCTCGQYENAPIHIRYGRANVACTGYAFQNGCLCQEDQG